MTKAKPKTPQVQQQGLPGTAGGHGPTEATRGGAVRMTDADLFPSPEVWATMKDQAQTLIDANMAPPKLDSVPKILVVMMRGRELGIPPMQACGSIFINDDGLPSMTAELMRARVYASGVGTIKIVEYTDEAARVVGIRYGEGGRPDQEQEFPFTLANAQKTGNTFSKGLPRHTLIARATSDCARLMFSDVLAGVVYTPEDLEAKRGATPPPPPPPPAAPPQQPPQEPPTAAEGPKGTPTPTPPPPAPPTAAPGPKKSHHKKKPEPAVAAQGNGQAGGAAPEAVRSPVPPAPPPPPSGMPDSGVPGRPWVHMVTVPFGDGPKSIWTHGITAETLLDIGDASRGDESLIEQGRRWLTARGAPKLAFLSEEEGREILEFLKTTRAGATATTEGRMPWEAAREQLEKVIVEYKLTPLRTRLLAEACRRYDVPGLEAIPAESLYSFVRELDEQGRVDGGAGLRLALERLAHEANP